MANKGEGKACAQDKSKKNRPSKAAEKDAHRRQRALEKQIDKNTREASGSSQWPLSRPPSIQGSISAVPPQTIGSRPASISGEPQEGHRSGEPQKPFSLLQRLALGRRSLSRKRFRSYP
uniref:Uncharacterized protein n=1 Tax=Micrurus lemniscatus lemniscatus TaxID=129467 RepID=A0A2D4IBU4_MICLE